MENKINLSEKKLIIFDLDGTLTPSKQAMPLAVGKALSHLLENKKVAVTSGGHFKQFEEQFLSSLPKDTCLVNLTLLPTSGGSYYEYQDGGWRVLYNNSFTDEEKEKIKNALEETIKESGLPKEEKVYGQRIEDRGSQITFSGLGQEAPLSAKETWDPEHKKRAQLVSILAPKIPFASVQIGGTTSIDITKKGIDKGYGIQKLTERTNIPLSETLYIGDALYKGGNDAPVLKTNVDALQVSGVNEVEKIIKDLLET